MNLQIQGIVTNKVDPVTKKSKNSGKDYTIAHLLIETIGQYPQPVKFSAFGDKSDLVTNVQVGETVNVFFDITGNNYEGKVFNNLQFWKIEKLSEAAHTNAPSAIPEAAGYDDDMPF